MTLTIRIATLCLTIIATVGSSTAWAVVCPSSNNNYVLTTQGQVDALGAVGCDRISGSLIIRSSYITNLDALSGITSVGGNLEIAYNPVLVRRQTIWDQSARFLRDTFLPVTSPV
jgi:hypothetical protein